jgi:hypothetical protein
MSMRKGEDLQHIQSVFTRTFPRILRLTTTFGIEILLCARMRLERDILSCKSCHRIVTYIVLESFLRGVRSHLSLADSTESLLSGIDGASVD